MCKVISRVSFLSFTYGHPVFLESFLEGAVFLPECVLVFLTVLIWGNILRRIGCGSLNVLWNLALNPSGPGLFLVRRLFLFVMSLEVTDLFLV